MIAMNSYKKQEAMIGQTTIPMMKWQKLFTGLIFKKNLIVFPEQITAMSMFLT